jgi:hypothetical protein
VALGRVEHKRLVFSHQQRRSHAIGGATKYISDPQDVETIYRDKANANQFLDHWFLRKNPTGRVGETEQGVLLVAAAIPYAASALAGTVADAQTYRVIAAKRLAISVAGM